MLNALTWPDFQKIFSSSRIGHLKTIFLKGRGFRGGSDEKIVRMWFGLGIIVVGLPPLVHCKYHYGGLNVINMF